MTYRTRYTGQISNKAHATDVRLTTEVRTPDLAMFAGTATLVFSSGSCCLQTYITSQQCTDLASALLDAAAALDQIALEFDTSEVLSA
jgi:hypothetical protein